MTASGDVARGPSAQRANGSNPSSVPATGSLFKERYYDPGFLNQLRGELERFYSVTDLHRLASEILDWEASQFGSAQTTSSCSRVLVDACVENDATSALLDALRQDHGALPPRLEQALDRGLVALPALQPGDRLGPYELGRELGHNELYREFLARQGELERRVRVLSYSACQDPIRLGRLRLLLRRVALLGDARFERQCRLEQIDGLFVISSEAVAGERLAERIELEQGLSRSEARALLAELVQALGVLHGSGLAQGRLTAHDIALPGGAAEPASLVLLNSGDNWLWDGTLRHVPWDGLAPEVLRGAEPNASSDVYSLACLAYRIIAGRSVFEAKNAQELAMAHLVRDPPRLSVLATRISVPPALDDYLLRCLNKLPELRPRDANEMSNALLELGVLSLQPPAGNSTLSSEEIGERIAALRQKPNDEASLTALTSSIEQGVDPTLIAQTLWELAQQLDLGDQADTLAARCDILAETARICAGPANNPLGAESAYRAILGHRPGDIATTRKLGQLYRSAGRHGELVDFLLEQLDKIEQPETRARLLHEIGELYETKLSDREQALVAYVQALCQDPEQAEHAMAVERLAADRTQTWQEVLTTCREVAFADGPREKRLALLRFLARAARERGGSNELALACYDTMSSLDPGNRQALLGKLELLRKTELWNDLGRTLLGLADAIDTSPEERCNLRAEAAKLLQTQLHNPASAEQLYLEILAEDPTHSRALEGLAQLLEAQGEFARGLELFKAAAEASQGAERHSFLRRAARLARERLANDEAAIGFYSTILAEAPGHAATLEELEPMLRRAGKLSELLELLLGQIEVSQSARQTAALWQRVAELYEQELLDSRSALYAYQMLLELEPGSGEAFSALERLYRQLGEWENLRDTYQQHLSIAADAARAAMLTQELALLIANELGDPTQALALLTAALGEHPRSLELWQACASVARHAADPEQLLLAEQRLAELTSEPAEKAARYLACGLVLEERGRSEEAIAHYKLALDADPKAPGVKAALHAAYLQQGDARLVVELLERELTLAEGPSVQAELHGQIARLALEQLQDMDLAEHHARSAHALDPSCVDGRYVLAVGEFARARYSEAASHFEHVVKHLERFDDAAGTRILLDYLQALAKTHSQQALEVAERLLGRAAAELGVLRAVAEVEFELGSPERAKQRNTNLLERAAELSEAERAGVLYRLGALEIKERNWAAAIELLEQALALQPRSNKTDRALCECYTALEQWEKLLEALCRSLEHVEDDQQRYELLVRVGDVAWQKLEDLEIAEDSYLLALAERAEDRKVLTRLMELYNQKQDWARSVDIVVKLAKFVDEPKQKAKYLLTAAQLRFRKLNDTAGAESLIDQLLELGADTEAVLACGFEMARSTGEPNRLKALWKRELVLADEQRDLTRALGALRELAELYLSAFGQLGKAISTYEGALGLDPKNAELLQRLTELYLREPEQYHDRAVKLQQEAIRHDGRRISAYQTLRKLYTKSKQPDRAYCVCQALSVLGKANPEEQRFFERLHTASSAVVQRRLAIGEWASLLLHPDCAEGPSQIFMLLHQAVFRSEGRALSQFGYEPEHQIDPRHYATPVLQSMLYVVDCLNVELPPLFIDHDVAETLRYLPAQPPSCVVGQGGLALETDPRIAAFIAASTLTRFLPGASARHLLGSANRLKLWLLAAIKLVAPDFTLPGDLQAAGSQVVTELKETLVPAQVERLRRLVEPLLRDQVQLDLNRWVAGIDFTADRLGFLFCNDLQVAIDCLHAQDPSAGAVPVKERIVELVRYSVSDSYFKARDRFGISLPVEAPPVSRYPSSRPPPR